MCFKKYFLLRLKRKIIERFTIANNLTNIPYIVNCYYTETDDCFVTLASRVTLVKTTQINFKSDKYILRFDVMLVWHPIRRGNSTNKHRLKRSQASAGGLILSACLLVSPEKLSAPLDSHFRYNFGRVTMLLFLRTVNSWLTGEVARQSMEQYLRTVQCNPLKNLEWELHPRHLEPTKNDRAHVDPLEFRSWTQTKHITPACRVTHCRCSSCQATWQLLWGGTSGIVKSF